MVVLCVPLVLLGDFVATMPPQQTASGARAAVSAARPAVTLPRIPPPPAATLYFRQRPQGQMATERLRYHSGVDIASVVSYYEQEMAGRGWKYLRQESEILTREYAREAVGQALVFHRAGARCLIAISEGVGEPGAMVTVVVGALPSAGTARERPR